MRCPLRHAARAPPPELKKPGANPTIESYSARVVKIYSTTSSLVGFENIMFYFTMKHAVAYYNAGIVVVN
jgi:hypothetical protein